MVQYLPLDPAIILARGSEGQGAAGRAGGHAILLLIMQPGDQIRVVRHGRLYGAPAARVIVWDGHNLRLGSPDEIDPASDEEAGGGEYI